MCDLNNNIAGTRFTLRPLTHADIEDLAEWLYQIPLYQRYEFKPPVLISSLMNALSEGDWLQVFSKETETLAFAWCQEHGTFGHSPYLRLIAVRPGYQRKGIGHLLLQEAEAWARLSHSSFTLLVSDFNHSAQRFYRREGYLEVGRLPKFVLDDVDEIIYHKKLNG